MVCGVCQKKCDHEGSSTNATKALSQTFGGSRHPPTKNLEGESKSTKCTDIHSDYVGNLGKIKLLEAHKIAYDMRDNFIVRTLVYEYAGAVDEHWRNCVATGFYLLSHWLKVSLCVVAQYHRDSYENFSDDDDIVSCEWTKELFMNSSYPALIKRVEEKYETMYGTEKGGLSTSRLLLMRCSI